MHFTQGKGRSAFVGVLGLIALLVAACGSGGGSTSSGPAAPYDFSYTYQTPPSNAGSTIIFGDHQKVDSLNPILLTSTTDLDNANAIFDGCIVQLPDLTLGLKGFVADQCAEVPSTTNGDEDPNGKFTLMKLDPKAVWSDGTPITADDYLFYADIYLDPNIGGAAGVFQFMKSVTRVDDHTVKITWNQPYAPYLYALWGPLPAHSFPQYYNVAKHQYLIKTAAQAGVLIADKNFNLTWPSDNGPYTVKSVSTDTIVFSKNPKFFSNYFHAASPTTFIFKNAGDVNTEIESFKTGQYDEATNFQIADTANFGGIPQNEQVSSSALGFEHIDFNLRSTAGNANDANNPTTTMDAQGNTVAGKSIFTNMLVRKAFIESFNLCGAFTVVLGKDCTDPNLHTAENTAPPSADYDPSVSIASYNVQQAQADLASAGFKNGTYPDGRKISLLFLTSANNPIRQAMVNYAATGWEKALGVNVNIIQSSDIFQPFTADKQNSLTQGHMDLSLFAYIDGTDPGGNLLSFQSTQIPSMANPNGGNDSGVNDPHIDQVLQQGSTTFDTTARLQLYKDLQKYITAQNYNIPLYIRGNNVLVLPSLGNFKLNPSSAGDDWNIADWYTTMNRQVGS